MKRLALVILPVILTAWAHAAQVPAVQKLLPAANAVKGFEVLPDSLVYGKGDDLSKIYDGGYELYTKNGVIDAARQMYRRAGDYVEVTVHTMESDKAATNFLKYWQKEHKVGRLTVSEGWTGFVVTKPNVTAYFARGAYFVTVSAFHSQDKAIKDVGAFRSAISKAIPGRQPSEHPARSRTVGGGKKK